MYDNQVHDMKKRCMRKHYRDLGDFLEGSGKEPIGTEPQLFMRTKKKCSSGACARSVMICVQDLWWVFEDILQKRFCPNQKSNY